MATFIIKQGDLKPVLSAYLTDNSGDAIDLSTAASVKFIMKARDGGYTKVDAVASISDATTGAVSYEWSAGDTSVVGTFDGEFEVNWGSSKYQSFPASGYVEIIVEEDTGGSA